MKQTIAVALMLGLVGMAGCDAGAKKTEVKPDAKAADGKVADTPKPETPKVEEPKKEEAKAPELEAPPAT
ncbi:MAG: hypothetical protein JNL82_00440 [Myxococcales bacterium]|nr:hypothetical protein [Myxococcales bacterium]